MQRKPRIDWRQLKYFRTAGRLQHVTKAAAELGTSQPALSRALAQLESELGISLFRRVGRSIALTPHGQKFLDRVERAGREIDEGMVELADLANPRGGKVALGFLRTLGVEYVPQLVRRFSDRFPNTRFNFRPNRSAILTEQLERGDLDLIFAAVPTGKSQFSWVPLQYQDLMLIVSPSHRLAHRREVALREVAEEPFIAFRSGSIRAQTDQLCATAGFTPNIVFEGDDSTSVPGLVAAGLAVAVVPPEGGRFAGVVSLRISEPSTRRAIGMAWVGERRLPASVRAFRDFAIASNMSSEGKKA
ncbi:MAG TPA: LysR family transcriptional regulator [Beijerinckiaceae bacterium]|nr:LysR family transcriptional regulator [Beijerinckiaceae bacterium]